MNYGEEKKRHISYCGSYCYRCDWHTGRIKKPPVLQQQRV